MIQVLLEVVLAFAHEAKEPCVQVQTWVLKHQLDVTGSSAGSFAASPVVCIGFIPHAAPCRVVCA